MKKILFSTMLVLFSLSACAKQTQITDEYIPEGIATPDTLKTSIGELNLRDGVPTKETRDKVFYNLDLQRATSVYLNNIALASINAIRTGILEFGEANKTVII